MKTRSTAIVTHLVIIRQERVLTNTLMHFYIPILTIVTRGKTP